MDVNSVLSHLILKHLSLPALKLAWDCQVDIKNAQPLPKISPSHYLQEHLLTTIQRRALICKQQQKLSIKNLGMDLIVEPAVLVFQNYEFGDVLTLSFAVRNASKTSQKVTILMDEDNVFRFDEKSQRVSKFSSGMSMNATIKFYPEENKDYYHKVVIRTQDACFAVPIIGIGGRGLLNISDSIIFDRVPVKYFQTKIIPVYNIGTKPANFTLSTLGQFCVKPEKCVILPKETFNLEVSHYSAQLGASEGQMLLKYDNGEEICVCLKAFAVESNVTLNPSVVCFEDTYISMNSKVICRIENNSEVVVDFKWTSFSVPQSKDNDNKETQWDDSDVFVETQDILSKAMDLIENCVEGEDCLDAAISVGGHIEEHYQLTGDAFIPEDFLIEPLFGQIQPYSCMEVTVIFIPSSQELAKTIAYLDITGKENRIPLKLSGRGQGPKFRFGFEEMNVGTVIHGCMNSYEIPVVNIGEVPGEINALGPIGKTSNMAMKVEPNSIHLMPDEHGAFFISMHCSGKYGEFQEEFKFQAPSTKEIFYLSLTGTLIFPQITFLEQEANFGSVSYGFPKKFQVSLMNHSMNFTDVSLKVEEDGSDPPMDSTKILESFKAANFAFDSNPSEFFLEPSKFTLSPRGMQRITVTVCANRFRDNLKRIVCYLVETDGSMLEDIASLPIVVNCTAPSLTCETPEVVINECFTQFVYPVEIRVRNNSDLSSCYCIIPQRTTKIRMQSDNLVGVIEPNNVTKISLKMLCTEVGKKIAAHYDFFIVGKHEKQFSFVLKVNSIATRLSKLIETNPKVIDFGNIRIMKRATEKVEIINRSQITTHYNAILRVNGHKEDSWNIDNEVGVLAPGESTTINVKSFIRGVGIRKAVIRFQMQESLGFIDIKVIANGVRNSQEFRRGSTASISSVRFK